jgi:hypothetical protein
MDSSSPKHPAMHNKDNAAEARKKFVSVMEEKVRTKMYMYSSLLEHKADPSFQT